MQKQRAPKLNRLGLRRNKLAPKRSRLRPKLRAGSRAPEGRGGEGQGRSRGTAAGSVRRNGQGSRGCRAIGQSAAASGKRKTGIARPASAAAEFDPGDARLRARADRQYG